MTQAAKPSEPGGAARRRFLGEVARAACGVAVAGLLLGLYARQGRALPAPALPPPGALTGEDFLGACLRCGLCVRACPYDTLSLAELGEGPAVGTPYFVAREVPCEMCEDIPCVAACPSGALDPRLSDIDEARMGTAVLVGQDTCLNLLGLRCDVCYRVCPLMGEAISLEPQQNMRTGKHTRFIPVVHGEHCTGCGKCEKSCVLEEAAIKVLPLALASSQIGGHYRLGWEEKAERGEALVPDLIDLPDRMPEAAP